jgi:catechol 2,3-dioxygenase-like lactoylglutathione lyase family enzyme
MMSSMHGSTTVSNIGVAMFTVADQDAARAFYTEKLGWEVRGDDRFGEDGAMRWLDGCASRFHRASRAQRADAG